MDNTLINRINELAEKSYSENRFVFTDFLDMSQLSTYYSLERDLSYVGTSVSGGTDGCERCMVRFGSPDSLGYEEAFPIVLLHISPVQKKFSDALTHRDFLGSVIGLGIERTKLGDIIARVYKLSRDLAVRYISEGKVFLSGRQMTENAKQLKAGDIVSVRGKGKFIFEGEGGNTRKDKLYINIKKYV